MPTVRLDLPEHPLRLGLVRAEGIDVTAYPADYDAWLERHLAAARTDDPERRAAVRDMLRWGRFKPSGRNKPASEYLRRLAQRDDVTFPRINAAVDGANAVSASTGLPISLWDADRAEVDTYVFRRGGEETYVFNATGQTLDLRDLVVGCLDSEGGTMPCVSPVKDSHRTKTHDDTTHVCAAIYAPLSLGVAAVEAACRDLAGHLGRTGTHVQTATAMAELDQPVSLSFPTS